MKAEIVAKERALETALKEAQEAQEKESSTLERLLPEMIAGSEQNVRLQSTCSKLEKALEKANASKATAEEEVTALRRLVAVLEETAASTPPPPSSGSRSALPPSPPPQAESHLLAQMAKSLANVEAFTEKKAHEESQRAANNVVLQNDLLAVRLSLQEAQHERGHHAQERISSEERLKEAIHDRDQALKEATKGTLVAVSASTRVTQLEVQLAEAQNSLQASQRELGEATAALRFTKSAAAVSNVKDTEIMRLEGSLQTAMGEIQALQEEVRDRGHEILSLDGTIAEAQDQIKTLQGEEKAALPPLDLDLDGMKRAVKVEARARQELDSVRTANTQLREENRLLQLDLKQRDSKPLYGKMPPLVPEESNASHRIDLLLGEMDRSIGDLSTAMHSSGARTARSEGLPWGELGPRSIDEVGAWGRGEVFVARKRPATERSTVPPAPTQRHMEVEADHRRASALLSGARHMLGLPGGAALPNGVNRRGRG